jgi:hypothetical protein
MTGQEAISIEAAGEHVAAGELHLRAASRRDDGLEWNQHHATLAVAHFTASMAITNILPAYPAEAPDVSF